ncbi:small ribosomal subunit biogenesis GTPase RsgA [Legionella spiritensis]|uniref:small ribosomal subunit biogenesis GTPase RsgA n=1 Tax=Legionella spiritensis TaxID=452 RepID=UPI000F71FDC2|nr:small ribosomal subunit biogenesis GTPase RsgA [Legionella spiritensis]VEG91853.1 EngC GTPase [Legionella spiritensis]
MSKRRINKQQRNRIEKIQADYHRQLQNGTNTDHEEGLVLSRFGRHADIETSTGEPIHCSIRPNIDSLVAGDRVVWQNEGENHGVVLSRFPRQSELSRPDKRGINRPVAANITQLMIVTAVKPDLSWSLLDSYLIIAEHLRLKACIILNKVDLPCEDLKQQLMEIYQPLGYPLLFLSCKQKPGHGQLDEHLQQQVSIFVGQSGVGKSSIIANILPFKTNIPIGAISEGSQLGRHTTSNSRLYHLPHGGDLIDSPGVREFCLWKMSAADIVYGFREFRSLTSLCKFRNCNHLDSPGCAILSQVNEGRLSLQRYRNLLKILAQNG